MSFLKVLAPFELLFCYECCFPVVGFLFPGGFKVGNINIEFKQFPAKNSKPTAAN